MGKLEGKIALITDDNSGIYHHNEEETAVTKNTDTRLFSPLQIGPITLKQEIAKALSLR
jgi:hypothetical protein